VAAESRRGRGRGALERARTGRRLQAGVFARLLVELAEQIGVRY